jgi:hypothetical protein
LVRISVKNFLDGSYLIYSDNITSAGKWAKEVDRCPEGSFANGFQVKTEKFQSPFVDDTAMNGLRLFCSDSDASVTSNEGVWGDWKNTYKCDNEGQIKGFQLRSEDGGQVDNTAANNIKMICTSGETHEGDGLQFGSYRGIHVCADNFVVCGIKTQIEPDQGPMSKYKNDIKLIPTKSMLKRWLVLRHCAEYVCLNDRCKF